MKRGILVLAGLLVLAGTSWADYIIIRVNLGGGAATGGQDPNAGPPGGYPGGGPGGGLQGPGGGLQGPGGGLQGPGGGMQGPGGGRGPGGGYPGGPGGGFPGGPGGPGFPGGRGPGGGYPGGGRPGPRGGDGGIGDGGGPGGGLQGPGGGPGGGLQGPGGGGGLPGPGGPGGFPGPGGPFGGGPFGGRDSGQDAPAEQDLRGNWFVTVVEADVNLNPREGQLPHHGYYITHRWHKSPLPLDPHTMIPDFVVLQYIKMDKPDKQLAAKRDQFVKDDPFRLADWMLQHWNFPTDDSKFDMQKRFEEFIDELAKRPFEGKDKARVDALLAVRDSLRRQLPSPDADLANLMRLPGLSDEYRKTTSPHYVILYQSSDERDAERKKNRLERVFASYYYWFALQGKTLPMPERQLICVLAESNDKFQSLHRLFDSLPMFTDGFYSPLDNVAVLSKMRVDGMYEQFVSKAASIEKNDLGPYNLDLEKMISNNYRFRPNDQNAPSPDTLALGKIMALAYRAAAEEGEIATLTHEGVQQLAAVSGLLPRRVQVPTAVRFGLGAFFESPKSDGELDYPSLWSGVGGPHWVYLRYFRKLIEAEKTGTLAFDKGTFWERKVKIDKLNMLKILTDQNFDAVEKADKKDQDVLRGKARAEAWALSNFFLRERLDNLIRFYNELAQLPRDMELSPEMVERVFARAFDLTDANDPDKTDPEKLAKLEEAWRRSLASLNLGHNQLSDDAVIRPKGNAPTRPGPNR